MNFTEIIFLFFAFIAFLLGFLFFIKNKGDKVANILLALYLILFGFNISYNVLRWSGKLFSEEFINLVHTNYIPWVLYGPILYLYVRRVIIKMSFKAKDLIHLIPFLYVLINYSPYYLLTSYEKIDVLTNGNWNDYMYYQNPHFIIIIIGLMLLYFLLILFSLKKHLKKFNKSRWLNWLVFSFLGYIISFTIYFSLVHFEKVELGYNYFVGFIMIFFIGVVTYFGFLQPDIFNGMPIDKVIPSFLKKYHKSGLSKEYSIVLKSKLLDLISNEKIHLKNDVKLIDIATAINISRNHASQVINEQLDMSFYDFINKYRVIEAIDIINHNDDANLNLTEIAYTVGFNNRISFYKAFKKFTGLSPSQYVRNKATS